MTQSFLIADRLIGPPSRCFVIGEVAQAHDGSLGTAHAFVDAIARSGADAIKFQTHIAAAESTLSEPWRVKFSRQDATRYDYWKRMEFTPQQWDGLRQHAAEKNLVFLSSPFSLEAADLLETIGMPAWKIASGEVHNPVLLKRIAATGKPVLISSGMSTLQELDDAVQLLRSQGCPVGVLQCTTSYPCPPESVGLQWLPRFQERYGCPVGLSDHSGTIYAGLAAATLGASLLEVHVTLSREMFGPDVVASVTTSELTQLVEGLHFIHRAMSVEVDKDDQATQLAPLRRTFGKSVVARRDLASGTILSRDVLAVKKPGTGIPAADIESVIGRRLNRSVCSDELLLEEYLADAG